MKKKILHIQVLPKLSGVQRISLEIFRGLPNDQYEKWILFSDSTDVGDKERCQREFEEVGVKVIYSSKMKREIGLSDFAAIIELYKLCRREKFDIVHTHSTKPGVVGRIAATLARVPMVVHTVHGLAFHQFVKFPKWQFYWACEMFASLFCDKITLVNHYYDKYFKWFRHKIWTIYNGVDFSAYPLLSHQIEIEIPKILFVGRLDTQKDPMTFLRAAKIVIAECPSAQFTLVGDGEKHNECCEFIRQNKLINNIELAGWQSDVASFYSAHNIFSMSSIYESFGLIFVEAAHYGLPIAATNVEGIPEVVLDQQTGLLCDPKDEKALAMNMLKLINDSELRITLGNAGRERVHKMFTNLLMVENYKKIYQR